MRQIIHVLQSKVFALYGFIKKLDFGIIDAIIVEIHRSTDNKDSSSQPLAQESRHKKLNSKNGISTEIQQKKKRIITTGNLFKIAF